MLQIDNRGFSLIEILIAMAILGILTVIAVPGYRGYMMRSNRAEARTDLLQSAQTAERFFTRNNTYVGGVANHATTNGLYNIVYVAPNPTSYTITAQAAGSQTRDANCLNLTVNQAGARGPAACW